MSKLLSETKYVSKILIVVIYLVLLGNVSCNSSDLELNSKVQIALTPNVKTSNTPQALTGKDPVALRLLELYDNKNCKEFFNVFPDNFKAFHQLYGYDEEGERVLFSKGNEHLTYFFNCPEVSDLEKLNKVVMIGIGGKWEADIVWMFQEGSFKLVKDNPDKTKEILENLPDEKASSFWYFLIDGPHPADKEKEERVDLLVELLGKDNKQSKLLLNQFQQLKLSQEH